MNQSNFFNNIFPIGKENAMKSHGVHRVRLGLLFLFKKIKVWTIDENKKKRNVWICKETELGRHLEILYIDGVDLRNFLNDERKCTSMVQ